ncbi:MAG: hypothetical protein HY650_06105 [Acidobacteria bacterium]|nr:hypothetical protein [Acidobacteriota bacterium]
MNKRSLRHSYQDVGNRSLYDPGNISRTPGQSVQQRKRVPPEQTHAENYYYRKQMEAHTPMVLVLNDGETIKGSIEWYDRNCLKVHRVGEPNLLIFKKSIKYLYKEGENDGSEETDG